MTSRSAQLMDDAALPPEADCLEDFLPPRETSELIGHDAAQSEILAALSSGRLHHGWLIEGGEGVGKATLAYRLARYLLADEAERLDPGQSLAVGGETATFAQVAALSHPNLMVLRRPWQAKGGRFGQDITVGEVRGLRAFLGNTAGKAGWRAVIVDRADDLNANAANALLKALEEPPERCIFLLVSAAPGRLPITIRSRCRALALSPLQEDDLARAVTSAMETAGRAAPEAAALRQCAALAEGSVRGALQLLSHDGLALYGALTRALGSIANPDYGALHKFADEVTGRGANARFELALRLLDGLLARLIRQAATGRGAIGDEAALSARLIPPSSLARWAELWETIQRDRADMTALNLDRKSFVLGVFFRLEETVGSAPGRWAR